LIAFSQRQPEEEVDQVLTGKGIAELIAALTGKGSARITERHYRIAYEMVDRGIFGRLLDLIPPEDRNMSTAVIQHALVPLRIAGRMARPQARDNPGFKQERRETEERVPKPGD
jgi:hypothetical protein